MASEDCPALADAVAVIVDAYFVEIAAATGEKASRKDTAAEPAARTSETKDGGEAPTREPGARAIGGKESSSPSSAEPSAGPHGPKRDDESTPRPMLANSASRGGSPERALPKPSVREELRLHVGVELLPALGLATTALGAGVGLTWPSPHMFAAVDLLTTVPTTHAIPDRVWRWASRAELRWGVGIGAVPEIRPWASLGVSRVQVKALDLSSSQPEDVWSLVVGAGIGVLQPVVRGWGVSIDFGCYLLGSQERYRVDPAGVLGAGPREGCGLGAGVVWLRQPGAT